MMTASAAKKYLQIKVPLIQRIHSNNYRGSFHNNDMNNIGKFSTYGKRILNFNDNDKVKILSNRNDLNCYNINIFNRIV